MSVQKGTRLSVYDAVVATSSCHAQSDQVAQGAQLVGKCGILDWIVCGTECSHELLSVDLSWKFDEDGYLDEILKQVLWLWA